jgi:hypothetical protein
LHLSVERRAIHDWHPKAAEDQMVEMHGEVAERILTIFSVVGDIADPLHHSDDQFQQAESSSITRTRGPSWHRNQPSSQSPRPLLLVDSWLTRKRQMHGLRDLALDDFRPHKTVRISLDGTTLVAVRFRFPRARS